MKITSTTSSDLPSLHPASMPATGSLPLGSPAPAPVGRTPSARVAAQWLFLQNVGRLIAWAQAQGLVLSGGELYRTAAQQRLYRIQGRSRITVSRHQDRLAIDLNLFLNGLYQADTAAYKALGQYWCSLHPANRWGGDWNRDNRPDTSSLADGNHFEMGG